MSRGTDADTRLMVVSRTRTFGLLVAAATLAGSASASSSNSTSAAPATLPHLQIDDLEFIGAFRISSADFGDSSVNYSAGPIGYHAEHNSLFVTGHAPQAGFAEFDIPSEFGTNPLVEDLPVVTEARQPFAQPLGDLANGNPDGIDRINGFFVDDAGRLIVNAERWYDAAGTAQDTTLAFADADNLDGPVDGYFEMDGAVHAGGYMSPVPTEWIEPLGGPVLTGWASNTSIVSRHTVGPSLFTFDPASVVNGTAATNPTIATTAHMDFPYQGGRYLHPEALDQHEGSAPDLWNHLARAPYGFIAPGTSTFVVLGSIGGVDSGIGYKITQDDGRLCGGYCSYEAADQHNAYWLFDLDDMLGADDVHLPRPYAYGTWDVPYDEDGQHSVIGASFDPGSGRLYVSLSNAGQVGTYDRPPLIVVFQVGAASGDAINRPAVATELADRVGLDG